MCSYQSMRKGTFTHCSKLLHALWNVKRMTETLIDRAVERIGGAQGKHKNCRTHYVNCVRWARPQEILKFTSSEIYVLGLLRLLFVLAYSTYIPMWGLS